MRDEFSVFQTNVNLNRRGESHIYQYFRSKVIVLRKIINDPVHGFITIDHQLIYQLIAHPYYQRLRRIKQMALAYYYQQKKEKNPNPVRTAKIPV